MGLRTGARVAEGAGVGVGAAVGVGVAAAVAVAVAVGAPRDCPMGQLTGRGSVNVPAGVAVGMGSWVPVAGLGARVAAAAGVAPQAAAGACWRGARLLRCGCLG